MWWDLFPMHFYIRSRVPRKIPLSAPLLAKLKLLDEVTEFNDLRAKN